MAEKFFPTYKIFIQKRPTQQEDFGGFVAGQVDELFLGNVKNMQESDQFTEIDYPLTIEFDIYRSTSGSSNTAYFSVYNLGEKVREDIVKDRFTQNDNADGRQRRYVYFFAGYGSNLNLVFGGNLVEAYTERNGADIITKIEAQDNLYEIANAISSHSIAKSQSYNQILDILIKDLKLKKGSIGKIFDDTERSRGFVILNNTYDEIRKLVGNDKEVFVDNGVINILNSNEYIAAHVPLVDNNSGLLGIPRRSEGVVIVDVIFEPTLIVGQIVQLKSELDLRFDGQYKIISINHMGTISGGIEGDRITRLELLIGTEELEPLVEVRQS